MLKLNRRSITKLCELNPNWKGDNVGYGKLHEWIRNRLSKPEKCPKCKVRNTYDLANKGVYNRDLNNWEWLCRKCHMESDGRLEEFLKHKKSFSKGNQLYKLRKKNLKGEESPVSKLNVKQVLEIRELYKSGKYTQQVLADKYRVCFQLISLIVLRKIWNHV